MKLACEPQGVEDQQHLAFRVRRFMHRGKQPDVQLCVQADAGTGSSHHLAALPARLNTALGVIGGTMGATAHLKSISPEVLGILMTRPKLVENFVCCYPCMLPPGVPDVLRESLTRAGLFGQVDVEMQEWLKEDAPDVAEILLAEAIEPHLYLDKAWVELSEALSEVTGEETVVRRIFGGTEIGPNLGYAPARYLTPEEVEITSRALSEVPISSTLSPVLVSLLSALKAFYASAAAGKRAVLYHLA